MVQLSRRKRVSEYEGWRRVGKTGNAGEKKSWLSGIRRESFNSPTRE
jgi:hypothetical protein